MNRTNQVAARNSRRRSSFDMTPSVLNRICAHPDAISWMIGACVLDTLVLKLPSDGVRLTSIASDWQGLSFLLLALAGATGLGCFLGMFACWPWIRPLCSKVNGAPFELADRVMILAGPLRGTTAEVEDITKGQGGWNIIWLGLGPERRKRFSNIFQEYSLFKMRGGQQGDSRNSRPPSQLPTAPEVQPPDSQRASSSGGGG